MQRSVLLAAIIALAACTRTGPGVPPYPAAGEKLDLPHPPPPRERCVSGGLDYCALRAATPSGAMVGEAPTGRR